MYYMNTIDSRDKCDRQLLMQGLVVQTHSSQKPILHVLVRQVEGQASALAVLVPLQAAHRTDVLKARTPHADFSKSKKRASLVGPRQIVAGADLLACQIGTHQTWRKIDRERHKIN